MTTTLNSVYRPSEDLVSRVIEEELLIIPMVAGIGDMENDFFAMDRTGQEIWKRLDGRRTVADIIGELKGLFQATPDEIRSDVIGFLDELARRRLIVIVESHG